MNVHQSIANLLPTLRLGKMSAEQMHQLYDTKELTQERWKELIGLMLQHYAETDPLARVEIERRWIVETREALNELRQN